MTCLGTVLDSRYYYKVANKWLAELLELLSVSCALMMGSYYPHGTLLSSRAGIPECRNPACRKVHLHRTSFLYPLSRLNAISIKNEWREYKEEHVTRCGSKIMILKVFIWFLSLCLRHNDKSLTKLSH